MPPPKKATLRELRTAEIWLQFYRESLQTVTKALEHVRHVLDSGAPHAIVVQSLQQAISEMDTGLRVAQRMHELRLQELQTTTKFPDET